MKAEDLCPNKSNQLYKPSWNEIARTLHPQLPHHATASVQNEPRRYPPENPGAD